MKQAIDELKAIPGVVGACLFGAQEGLLQTNLPGIFKPEKLTEVGKQLSKLLKAGGMSFSDINDLTLHYDESVVIARELRKGLLVFAICDPSFNHNLLTMSLNLLQEEIKDQTDIPPAADSGASSSLDGREASPELVQTLDEIRTLLSKVLGPMAGIIFDEIHQEWARQGATAERLPALLESLNVEIGDPEKIATFGSLVAPLLQR